MLRDGSEVDRQLDCEQKGRSVGSGSNKQDLGKSPGDVLTDFVGKMECRAIEYSGRPVMLKAKRQVSI